MDSTVLAETEAFIARQREALVNLREELLNQQRLVQDQLDELDVMLTKSMCSRASRLADASKRVRVRAVVFLAGVEASEMSC